MPADARLKAQWARLEQAYTGAHKKISGSRAAKPAELAKLSRLPFALPSDYLAFLKLHDGASLGDDSIDFLGTKALVLDDNDPHRILFARLSTFELCFDFHPGPKGRRGQIVTNHPDWHVIANDFSELLELITDTTLAAADIYDPKLSIWWATSPAEARQTVKKLQALKAASDKVHGTPRAKQTAAFIAAAARGKLAKLKALYAKGGVDINGKNAKGRRALTTALEACNLPNWHREKYGKRCAPLDRTNADVVRWLVEIGCDVNAFDEPPRSHVGAKSPIHWLVEAYDSYEFSALLRLLVEAGADINGRTQPDGQTPLLRYANLLDLDQIELMIELGANIHAVDTAGQDVLADLVVPYEGAPEREYFAKIEYFVRAGVDVNRVGRLHCNVRIVDAARAGHLKTVRLLLAHGADLTLRDWDGRNALDGAMQGTSRAKPEIIALLKKAGAKPARG